MQSFLKNLPIAMDIPRAKINAINWGNLVYGHMKIVLKHVEQKLNI